VAEVVYALCAATSLACAVLLLRGYAAGRVRLLLWTGLCFAGLFVNNVLLFLDKVVITDVDLSLARSATALGAVVILLYGLIWETRCCRSSSTAPRPWPAARSRCSSGASSARATTACSRSSPPRS
jgi:Family of unknown function (DUF5985)